MAISHYVGSGNKSHVLLTLSSPLSFIAVFMAACRSQGTTWSATLLPPTVNKVQVLRLGSRSCPLPVGFEKPSKTAQAVLKFEVTSCLRVLGLDTHHYS